MSFCFPNIKPSYHFFTVFFSSGNPCSSRALNTSFSVKPNAVSYFVDNVVTTSRLLRSLKMLSFDTLVIPVIIALSRYGFVLKVELNKLLVNPTSSSQ